VTVAEPRWKSAAEFEKWWRENVIEFNRLAVTDVERWEVIAAAVEKFQAKRWIDEHAS